MTSSSGQSFGRLIDAARAGDKKALGELLQKHRGWLRLFVAQRLRPDVRQRVGESDLVQQTLLSALRAFPQFQGGCAAELQAWLKKILDRNLADTMRVHVEADCRSVTNEEPGPTVLASPDFAADESVSPIQALLFGEDAARIAEAVDELPEDQREAVRLRYLEDFSIQDLAQPLAVRQLHAAGLVKRGLATLRERLVRE